MRIAVFPGSFDPVTIGHQDIIARASKLFDRVYVSIVPNGTKTHPMFTDEQKLALMRASVEEFPNVEAELGGGLLTDYALRKNAQFLVRGVRNSVDFDAERHQFRFIYRFGESLNAVVTGMYFHQQCGIFIHRLTIIIRVRAVGGPYFV